jgi:HK97 gp10 family phage protein
MPASTMRPLQSICVIPSKFAHPPGKVAEIRWSPFGLAQQKHYMKALAQEFGTVKQVADPFIRPALDYNVQQVLRILTVEIRNGIQNR